MGGANAGDDDLSSEAGSEALPFALTGNRRLPLRMNGRGVSKGPSLLHHISTTCSMPSMATSLPRTFSRLVRRFHFEMVF